MIDFHCHLLSGLDDGPANIDESVAMAAALREAGFRTICCTPHLIKGCFDADNQAVLSSVSTLQTRLNAENIELEILPGHEYYLDEFLGNYLKDPLPLGKTNYILIEVSNYTPAEYVKETFFRIKCGGFIPMIAHPERCKLFAVPKKHTTSRFWFSGSENKTSDSKTEKPTLIEYLKNIGCAFQGNLGSFDGLYGPEVQQTADYLKKNKVYTHFGTDAHSLQAITSLSLTHSLL
ncbi:MAG: CpsB/CapC family capsule biosynthesis tyrosine phosphatase [Smithella sp.]|jgi:protein-tyrosine phosphatase